MIDLSALQGRSWYALGDAPGQLYELAVCGAVAASASPCPLTAGACVLAHNATALAATVLGQPAAPILANGTVRLSRARPQFFAP